MLVMNQSWLHRKKEVNNFLKSENQTAQRRYVEQREEREARRCTEDMIIHQMSHVYHNFCPKEANIFAIHHFIIFLTNAFCFYSQRCSNLNFKRIISELFSFHVRLFHTHARTKELRDEGTCPDHFIEGGKGEVNRCHESTSHDLCFRTFEHVSGNESMQVDKISVPFCNVQFSRLVQFEKNF